MLESILGILVRCPSIFIIFAFLLYINHRRKQSIDRIQKKSEDFWDKEARANWVRKKDLSSLNYIDFSTDFSTLNLSLGKYKEEPFVSLEQTLLHLAEPDVKILNLNGISNTDLKLQYGPANLDFLSQCDNHYTTLISTMANYAEALFQKEDFDSAKRLLELAITYQTDIRKNYDLLATIYIYEKTPEKISGLISVAEQLDSIMKPSIIKLLQEKQS